MARILKLKQTLNDEGWLTNSHALNNFYETGFETIQILNAKFWKMKTITDTKLKWMLHSFEMFEFEWLGLK